MSKLTLYGFKACPFTLKVISFVVHKKLDINIEFIDPNNRPNWFNELNPLGKVPLLKVDNNGILYTII